MVYGVVEDARDLLLSHRVDGGKAGEGWVDVIRVHAEVAGVHIPLLEVRSLPFLVEHEGREITGPPSRGEAGFPDRHRQGI